MAPLPNPTLELRHYRSFVVLTDLMHFGLAAEKLGISQPALSQQLRLMERSVGAPLLERNQRKVELTETGRVLREQALAVLRQAEQAQFAIAQAAAGNAGLIRLGYVASASLSGVMPRLVYRFRQAHPAVQILVQERDMEEQVALLSQATLDIAFIRPPVPDMPEGIAMLPLLVEPMVAVLHVKHPLARRPKIHLRELADDTFICTHQKVGVGFYAITMEMCRKAGFTPRIEVFSSQTSVLIGMVAAGFGVALVPASTRSYSPQDVVFLPMVGNSVKTELAIAFSRHNRSPAARAFVAIARDNAGAAL